MSLRDKPGFTDVGGLLEFLRGIEPRQSGQLSIAFQFAEAFRARLKHSDTQARFQRKASSSYSTADVRLGWHARRRSGFFGGRTESLAAFSLWNLEAIPDRWWESREASTERSRGEGDANHAHKPCQPMIRRRRLRRAHPCPALPVHVFGHRPLAVGGRSLPACPAQQPKAESSR